jgi:glutaredoxin
MYQREVVLHARSRSLRCWRAKRLLARAGYHFEVVEAASDSPLGLRKRLTHGGAYRQTVPYLFVDGRPVGGLAEIRALSGSGILERLVRGEL